MGEKASQGKFILATDRGAAARLLALGYKEVHGWPGAWLFLNDPRLDFNGVAGAVATDKVCV